MRVAESYCQNPLYGTSKHLIQKTESMSKPMLCPLDVKQGGRRIQGLRKKRANNMPLVTIVTVVYNGEAFLESTIKSVIDQSYSNIEYIIIDGGSTDSTLDILKKYENTIDYWVSAKDEGIYDAMNKGIDLATGEWICFMNGGDEFHHKTVLSEIFFQKDYIDVDIIVGNHEVIYPSGRTRLAKAGKLENIWKGSQFCHQATFVKADFHKSHKFNLKNRIVADFEFFYKAYKANAKFQFLNVTVVTFQAGGLSDVNRIEAILGWWLTVDKSPNLNIFYCYLILKEVIKCKVKSVVFK